MKYFVIIFTPRRIYPLNTHVFTCFYTVPVRFHDGVFSILQIALGIRALSDLLVRQEVELEF